MPRYKEMGLIGVLFVLGSVVSVFVNSKLFGCSGSFVAFPQILNFLELIVNIVSLAAFVLIPTGLVLSYKGYIDWRREKSKSPVSIFIELLGVTILLLVLLSVWLASFNSTRNMGPDAAVKSALSSVRVEAQLHYERTSSYEGICENNPEIFQRIDHVRSTVFKQGLLCARWSDVFKCNSSKDEFAVSAPLMFTSAPGLLTYFCVDSTGFAGVTDTPATGTACPK